jgi:predicted ferric reductase
VRLDIQGVRWLAEPGYHAYVFFPTLQPLRPWENHPFSITNTAVLTSKNHVTTSAHALSYSGDCEVTKSPQAVVTSIATGSDSISIYIKKHRGMTRFLQGNIDLPVLLDGPYRGNPSREVLKCDRILLIGGGIGITGLLTWTHAHINIKLAWSLKESARPILQNLEPALSGIADKVVTVGQRLDIEALLTHEIEIGWNKVGVVVCGPPGLCDDVRSAVVRFGKRERTVFELEVDAFGW